MQFPDELIAHEDEPDQLCLLSILLEVQLAHSGQNSDACRVHDVVNGLQNVLGVHSGHKDLVDDRVVKKVSDRVVARALSTRDLRVVGLPTDELTCLVDVGRGVNSKPGLPNLIVEAEEVHRHQKHEFDHRLLRQLNFQHIQEEPKIEELFAVFSADEVLLDRFCFVFVVIVHQRLSLNLVILIMIPCVVVNHCTPGCIYILML